MSKGMNKNTSIYTTSLMQELGPKMDWSLVKKKRLIGAILAIKDADEAQRFLRDLMTPTEIEEFANRLEAASLLSSDMQYNYIIEKTGLSSATIARIAKWLGGSLGGYRLILNRLNKSNMHHNNPTKLKRGLSLT